MARSLSPPVACAVWRCGQAQGIIDYSLLIGVHRSDKPPQVYSLEARPETPTAPLRAWTLLYAGPDAGALALSSLWLVATGAAVGGVFVVGGAPPDASQSPPSPHGDADAASLASQLSRSVSVGSSSSTSSMAPPPAGPDGAEAAGALASQQGPASALPASGPGTLLTSAPTSVSSGSLYKSSVRRTRTLQRLFGLRRSDSTTVPARYTDTDDTHLPKGMSVFQMHDGGCASERVVEADNTVVVGEETLYVGIIDILIPYETYKQGEHLIKSIVTDGKQISVVPPEEYGPRFQKFCCDAVV